MPKTQTPQPAPETAPASGNGIADDESSFSFNQAIQDAKTGAENLVKGAQERSHAYREQLAEHSKAWREEAHNYGEQAKSKAGDLADQGKIKTGEALSDLGGLIAGAAPMIDEKIGAKYGDYARSAAERVQQGATSLDNKSVEDLGDDIKTFIRENPGVALGVAAATGFLLARMLRGKK